MDARIAIRTLLAAAFAAGVALAASPAVAQTRAGPLAMPADAAAAARAAMEDTARGNALHVTLLTQGQGEAVWERYGHNLIWIRNDKTGESLLWNWGVFNFAEPGFIGRFLFGSAMYRIAAFRAPQWLDDESHGTREVIAQDLVLTPGQRAAVDAFVRANALPQNQYYRYDYFLDNCSTRLRDMLDFVLGGAMRQSIEAKPGAYSYRDETLRLNQHNTLLFLGLDLALGLPADRTMTPWESAFVPMRLRDELRSVRVPGPGGTMVPLVENERVLIRGREPAEATRIESGGVRAALFGVALVVALLALWLGFTGKRGALVALAVPVHVVFALAGTLLVFMWLFTRHAFWAWNMHLLLFTPVSWAVVVSLLRSRARRPAAPWVARYHRLMAVSGFVVGVCALAWPGRWSPAEGAMLAAWAGAAWLIHLSIGLALKQPK
ncbi:MAG TPA: DUF4105 domain-containing protein [Gemmatimonadaceae bacterium]|nr:DUF4105 domain-containing protein [Gemmatimonadaceae bacterium]